jgi:Dolichyl-phosphate-mannose-protein mannosyltransferase
MGGIKDEANTTAFVRALPVSSVPVGDPTPHHASDNWWLLLVALVAGAVCAPFLRTVYWLGDEGVLLRGAEQILKGRRLYVDFFEFLPPAGFDLTAAWLGLTGVSFVSARLLAILTIVGTACFTFLACRRACKNAPLSALLTIGWLVMSQGEWTQVNHHWFATMFSMVAAWASLCSIEAPHQRWRWPLIAGLAAGTAAMVTPTRGALAMIAAATPFLSLRRQWRELTVYLLGGALVPLGLIAYVVWDNAFAAGLEDVIILTGRRYASIQYVPFSRGANDQNRPLRYLFPLVFLLMCFMFWRSRYCCLRDRPLRACGAFGLAGFVGCFPRPDLAHIAFAAPLALPLLAACTIKLTRAWHQVLRYILLLVLVTLGLPSVASFLSMSQRALRLPLVQTPRGSVAIINQPAAGKMLARIAAAPAEDSYLFYPYMPLLPFLAARQHVSKYDIFVPGYTLDFEYQDACRSALQRASWVVFDRGWMDFATLRKVFPAMRDSMPVETMRFEQVLESNFDLVAKEGRFELRHRRENASEVECDGIVH